MEANPSTLPNPYVHFYFTFSSCCDWREAEAGYFSTLCYFASEAIPDHVADSFLKYRKQCADLFGFTGAADWVRTALDADFAERIVARYRADWNKAHTKVDCGVVTASPLALNHAATTMGHLRILILLITPCFLQSQADGAQRVTFILENTHGYHRMFRVEGPGIAYGFSMSKRETLPCVWPVGTKLHLSSNGEDTTGTLFTVTARDEGRTSGVMGPASLCCGRWVVKALSSPLGPGYTSRIPSRLIGS